LMKTAGARGSAHSSGADHDRGRGCCSPGGPGQARLHRDPAERAVGGRLHLRSDPRRVCLRRVRDRRVLPDDRGLASGSVDEDRSAAGRVGHGAVAPRPRRTRRDRPGSSLRCRQPGRIQVVVATPRRKRCEPVGVLRDWGPGSGHAMVTGGGAARVWPRRAGPGNRGVARSQVGR